MLQQTKKYNGESLVHAFARPEGIPTIDDQKSAQGKIFASKPKKVTRSAAPGGTNPAVVQHRSQCNKPKPAQARRASLPKGANCIGAPLRAKNSDEKQKLFGAGNRAKIARLDLNKVLKEPDLDEFGQIQKGSASSNSKPSFDSGDGIIVPDSPRLIEYRKAHQESFERKLRLINPAGGGLHDSIYYAALAGVADGVPEDEIAARIFDAAKDKGRECGVLHGEIVGSIQSALRYFSGSPYENNATPRLRIKPNYGKIEAVVLSSGKLNDLSKSSKEMPKSIPEVLGALFPKGSLVCCGSAAAIFATRFLEEWQNNPKDAQFIVPSPMSKKFGLTTNGRPSQRSNDNTGPRRYQVIEFDFKPDQNPECLDFVNGVAAKGYNVSDINAALHLHLQGFLPLGMAVSSGNASIHGWYPCVGVPESDLLRL